MVLQQRQAAEEEEVNEEGNRRTTNQKKTHETKHKTEVMLQRTSFLCGMGIFFGQIRTRCVALVEYLRISVVRCHGQVSATVKSSRISGPFFC